jgi:uncharacterized Zn finger protein (UPF0148 family)
MLPCSVCGAPTLLLVNGVPICSRCDDEREARRKQEAAEADAKAWDQLKGKTPPKEDG